MLFGRDLYKQSMARWQTLKPAFDDLIKKYPANWNRNAYARLACLAGDVEAGKKQLDFLKRDVTTYGWDYPEMLSSCLPFKFGRL
jgi:hypothetical protein